MLKPGSSGVAAIPGATPDTLAEAMQRYEGLGFRGQFAVRGGGRLHCLSCGRELAARQMHLQAMHRLEGASDPDEEAAVAALECGSCGTKGTVVLSFGPAGSLDDRQVLAALDDRRNSEGPVRPGM